MTDNANVTPASASLEEIQQGWRELTLRVAQLEAEKSVLEQEHKALRFLLERVIDHRQKSHNELVLLLTDLASRLPLNDVGGIVSRLVEHNTNVGHVLAALVKGKAEVNVPQPAVLKTLDQTKRDLLGALKPAAEELIRLDTPFEGEMLQALITQPELFFSPRMVRANRCFIKGQVPRERIVREFGEEALVFFNDMTTDPKLNPRPKPDEIALGFKSDFETLFQQYPGVVANKREELAGLYQRVQRSKTPEQARSQRIALQKLSFIAELLHFYEHQNTEAPDVLFAQRLPALVEQLALAGLQDNLDENLILQAEGLIAFVINPDHRQMIVNNVGKGSAAGKTLKYVLRLRVEKVPDADQLVPEFVKHLIPPPPQAPPRPEILAASLRLILPEMQRRVVRSIMDFDKVRKEDAETLARAISKELGLPDLVEQVKAQAALTPEAERQIAWTRVKEMIVHRTEAAAIAAAIRERLNTKYDADEIRQSWITLTEADPLSLIKIFCQIPYLATGKTDPIARTVMETYVTRLMHEKYAATYKKVVTSLRNMFAAKPDSPTLVNFIALVRWVDPEAGNRLCADIGMPVQAH